MGLTIFFSILSLLQAVSYVKVHVYCVFDYFLFNLVFYFRWVTWKCMFIVFDFFHFNLVSTSVGELFKSACLLCVWLFSFQSCLHFSRWVTWKCMFIVYLTIFPSILTPLQSVSYVKVHVYCVFDYFLFNLVSTSGGELCKSACYCVDYFLFNFVSISAGELCVWLFSLQSCLHFRRWVTWKCMFIVLLQSCLHFSRWVTSKVHVYCVWLFSLQYLSPLCETLCLLCLIILVNFNLHFSLVSYVKVHVYCVFDYFLFNLVSTSVGELWKCMFIVCLTIFSSNCLDFRRWVTWKCMFIVCLTIFTSILSPLQSVSYVKVHVYCVFDYFLFNFVSTSVGELRESACLLRVWLFSLQSCLHFSRWVTWKCMFIVCFNCLTSASLWKSILSPLQSVSYMKVHVYCSVWLLISPLQSVSSWMYLYCVWLFSFQSCLRWVSKSACVFDYFLFNLVHVSYMKVHVYCVFDYFLFNLVSTSVGELRESACLLCV